MYTSTHFYFNVIDFPTTVHLMSNSSDWYAVSSAAGPHQHHVTPRAKLPKVAWQRNFVHRHRGRLLPVTPSGTPARLLRPALHSSFELPTHSCFAV